jgi:hypothetical protein
MAENDLNINIRANNLAGASFQQLNQTLRDLEGTLGAIAAGAQRTGKAITDSAQASIDTLNREIETVKAEIVAREQQAASINQVTAAIKEQGDALAVVHRTLQQNIDASFAVGADRQIKSATESARVLATSLSAAAEADARFRAGELQTAAAAEKAATALIRQGEAVRTLRGDAFFGAYDRRLGIGTGRTSAAASAATFEKELGPAEQFGPWPAPPRQPGSGSGITSVPTRATIDTVHGIGQAYLSAAASAEVFNKALGPTGGGITSVGTRSTIDTLQGINRELLSAKESAKIFQETLGPAGIGIISTETRGTIDTLHGIGQAFLSAKDSAQVFLQTETAIETEARIATEALAAQAEALRANSVVQSMSGEAFFGAFNRRQGIGGGQTSAAASAAAFQAALGPAGGGITTASIQDTINRLHGINTEFLSAAESAKVFRAAMGPIGTGVVTADLQATINRIQGIGREYLSAADSAKVFVAAETAAETAARMAAVEQEAAAERAERAASRARIRKLQEDAEGGGGLSGVSMARHGMALLDEASRGQRGAMISSLGAAARDAGLGVAGLTTSMAGLVAIMGASAIVRGASEMGKWATETRAAASATGMSIQQFSALAGAMTLMGLKGEEADASMRHLAEQLATALADPASKAAEAFQNLGIAQSELEKTGGNTAAALKLLADAFVLNADGANKTENMNQLLGRGFEKLIPLLQNGSAGMEEMTGKANELGLTLNESTAKSLETTGQKVDELAASIRGEGIAAMVAWGPVIQGLVGLLEDLGKAAGFVITKLGQVATMMNSASIHIPGTTKSLNVFGMMGAPGISAIAEDKTPTGPRVSRSGDSRERSQITPAALTPAGSNDQMTRIRAEAEAAALAAGQGAKNMAAARQAEGQAYIAVLEKEKAAGTLNAKQQEELQAQINAKKLSLLNEGIAAQDAAARKGASAAAKAAKQSYEDFAGAEREKIAQANGSADAIIAIYNEWAEKAASVYKQNASVVEAIERQKIQAVNKAKLEEIRNGAKAEEEVNKGRLVLGKAQMLTEGKSDPEQTAALAQQEAQQIEAAAQKEVAALTEIMNSAEKGSEVQKAAAQEILAVVTQAKQQEVSLYQKAAQATQQATQSMIQPVTQLFNSIGNQFEGLTSSLVKALVAPQVDLIKQGLTTIKINERNSEVHKALQKFALDMVQDAAKSLEDAASKTLTTVLSNALNIPLTQGASGLGGLLSSGLSKLVSGGSSSALSTAQFGLSATQLQAAGTGLSAAGTVLSTSGTELATTATSAGAALTGAATSLTASASALTAAAASSSASSAASGGFSFLKGAATLGVIGGGLPFFARGGIVSSAAGGMIVGGNGASLAVLHEQEMVLPRNLSTGIQSMINNNQRGGNAQLNYSPTINTSSRSRGGTGMTRAEFQQMMTQHGGSLMGEARNMMRSGFRPG